MSALDIVEIAKATGTELETVAPAYFSIGHELELPWLRAQVDVLPRDDRWHELARSALLEDLYAVHRSVTADIMACATAGAEAAADVAEWLARNAQAVGRYLGVLAEAKAAPAVDVAVLSVALREIRSLTVAPAKTR
jgi:glutamate dehydrogenase